MNKRTLLAFLVLIIFSPSAKAVDFKVRLENRLDCIRSKNIETRDFYIKQMLLSEDIDIKASGERLMSYREEWPIFHVTVTTQVASATVKYCSVADALLGKDYHTSAGNTPCTIALRKGVYNFIAERNGKETSRKENVRIEADETVDLGDDFGINR